MSENIAVPSAAELGRADAPVLGGWWGVARSQLTEHTTEPLFMLFVFGWETLGYMLLGMAALKTAS